MGAKLNSSEGGRFALSQKAEINVTPFVDVMLVLTIVFMLAVPLATVSIKLDLPPGEINPLPAKPPVFVNVQPLGHVFIGDREVTLGALDAELSKALSSPDPTRQTIAIKAGRNVRYQDFLTVLNTLQAGGFSRIGLITETLV